MRTTISHFYPNLASSDALAKGKGEHRKVRNVGVGTILSQASESEIAEWVKELRGDGIPVSTMMLTEKALEVAEEAGVQDFKASDKWVLNKNLNTRGQKTVWVKCSGASKERSTVMLLGDSKGDRCMPFIVFKVKPSKDAEIQEENYQRRYGFGRRNWKDVRCIRSSTRLEVYGNSKEAN
ncbi:Tc5 transposase DNA-binding domain [Phytophthora infestans]|uniref:Tc5 transposase DNA-binding domain n=1 Tax=Phytophthora infestans TaxID=4787 RepID=A0A833SCV3_PHYIN|nr:Tc5 transposase DNA-binding domain [Phytophthora infestans]